MKRNPHTPGDQLISSRQAISSGQPTSRGSRTSRRDFLRIGATGLAGAAFLASSTCSPQPEEMPQDARKIVYRTLGRTGLKLPVVSMGTSYAMNLIQAALDEGIVYIHTSSDYSDGKHERLLGRVLRNRPRESFVIASCPDLPYEWSESSGESFDLGTKVNPELISESLEGSLERLGLDYVDIYYLGSIGSRQTTLHRPYMEEFEKLKTNGKTRFVGITTHRNEPEVIRTAAASGFWDVVLTAYNFRQSHREELRAAIREAAEAGLGVVAMKTQAGVFWDTARLHRINMKAALKWVLQDENVHTTIPAFSNFEEMREDISIMENLDLTPEEKRDLAMGDELGFSGLYCQQCGYCLTQCPAGVEIPTLMRSYMYAFGHQQPRKARDTLRAWKSSKVACRTCGRCAVTCSLGFDVKARALDIARILEVPEEFLG